MMKNRVVKSALMVTALAYLWLCWYLLIVIERERISANSKDPFRDVLEPACVCESVAENKTGELQRPWNNFIPELHRELEGDMCTLNDLHTKNHQSDIKMFDVITTMKVKYPKYMWTHTGWIQQLDSTYDSHSWDSSPLQVYVIPFSHHDPGWKSTVDSYFNSWTKYTLTIAVKKLLANPNMRFVWAEVIFLKKWFDELDPEEKDNFIKVLVSKQFEVLTGGWVMTDEAVSHYSAMIDQLIEGHQYLANTFNYTVRHAWAIDPFGHSSTMPYILKKSGIKDMLIQRVHYAVKQHLAESKNLEFMWRQSWSSSSATDLHCHLTPFMLYNMVYSCGPDIQVCCWMDFSKNKCWKWGKFQEAEGINDKNIEAKSWELLDQLRKKAQFYRHNIVLLPHGDDFRFATEARWEQHFDNLDKLMVYMNSHKEMHVHMRYATLGEYFNASKKALKNSGSKFSPSQTLPVLSGDFFTYTDRDDQYWSGYYSTRPVLKYMTRYLQAKLKCAEILFSLGMAYEKKKKDIAFTSSLSSQFQFLTYMRQSMGLLQHHDAITGTATITVVKDYLEHARNAVSDGNKLISIVASTLLNTTLDMPDTFVVMEHQPTWKSLPAPTAVRATHDVSILAIFNSLATTRREVVKIISVSPYVQLYDIEDNAIQCQVNPVLHKNLEVDGTRYAVYFLAKVAPFGMAQYSMRVFHGGGGVERGRQPRCELASIIYRKIKHHHDSESPFKTSWSGLSDFKIQNTPYTIHFCKCSGLMNGVVRNLDNKYYQVGTSFITYHTGRWWNPLKDKSGAYVFIPDGEASELKPKKVNVAIVEGKLVSMVHTDTELATQIVTLYKENNTQGLGIHLENRVDISEQNNTEIGMRLKTNVYNKNDPYFYTDLNGFQFVKRKTQARLPLQANFYPMTTHMFMEDDKNRVCIHSFQSHGVSSLQAGWFEVILDRRLNQDDWRGLSQGVTDNVKNTPSYFILTLEKRLAARNTANNAYPSHISHQISSALMNPLVLLQNQEARYTGAQPFIPLNHDLPSDFQVTNLRLIGDEVENQKPVTLLMVIHRVGIDCNIAASFAQTSNIMESTSRADFSKLFIDFSVQNVTETSLTGTENIRSLIKFIIWIESGEIKSFTFGIH